MSHRLKQMVRTAHRDFASQANRAIAEFTIAALLVVIAMTIYARVADEHAHNIGNFDSQLILSHIVE